MRALLLSLCFPHLQGKVSTSHLAALLLFILLLKAPQSFHRSSDLPCLGDPTRRPVLPSEVSCPPPPALSGLDSSPETPTQHASAVPTVSPDESLGKKRNVFLPAP